MADKPDKDFGKRKPVSVPASPRPAQPPAKRSGHVALLLMGTFAVGSTAYALMPSRNCEPSPNAASSSLQQGNTECSSRDLHPAATAARVAAQVAAPAAVRRAAATTRAIRP
ncbi:MAG: hypothetical protein E6G93_07380, partial [Alphaproteobacteria bacterium]